MFGNFFKGGKVKVSNNKGIAKFPRGGEECSKWSNACPLCPLNDICVSSNGSAKNQLGISPLMFNTGDIMSHPLVMENPTFYLVPSSGFC